MAFGCYHNKRPANLEVAHALMSLLKNPRNRSLTVTAL